MFLIDTFSHSSIHSFIQTFILWVMRQLLVIVNNLELIMNASLECDNWKCFELIKYSSLSLSFSFFSFCSCTQPTWRSRGRGLWANDVLIEHTHINEFHGRRRRSSKRRRFVFLVILRDCKTLEYTTTTITITTILATTYTRTHTHPLNWQLLDRREGRRERLEEVEAKEKTIIEQATGTN